MDKLFATFGKISVVLFIGGLLVGGGYYLGQAKKSNTAPANTAPTSPIAQKTVASPTIAINPTSTAPTHFIVSAGGVSPFVSYTLVGINGWNLDKKHVDLSDQVTLTQGEYTVTIYQAAIGGGGCSFPGDQPGPMSITLTNPIDIPLQLGQPLRRGTAQSPNTSQMSFTICQKRSDGSYGTLTTFGAISYTTPLSPDPEILAQMDGMVGSLQKQ